MDGSQEKVMERVSLLAQLTLDEAEKETFQRDVGKMLSYVDKLKEVNTDGVEPLCQVTEDASENVFREDVVTGQRDTESLLDGAPSRRDDFFVVPKSFA